ncbi:MAG TPA: hypothetical protein PKE61_16015, partial [Burkholderiaceae bacterium]|nr:hypothetical protein [Burkholderiaceae bacterium]
MTSTPPSTQPEPLPPPLPRSLARVATLSTAVLGEGTVAVMPGDGQGGFGPRPFPAVTAEALLGDINRDGRADAVTLRLSA